MSARPTRASQLLRDGTRLGFRLAAHLTQAEHDVLRGRQVREQIEHLEHHAGLRADARQLALLAAPALAACTLDIADLDPVEPDRAFVVRLEHIDAAQQRGLAAARTDR